MKEKEESLGLLDAFDFIQDIKDMAFQLDRLSSAFYTVGNNKVSEDLAEIAANIREDAQLIKESIGGYIHRESMTAQANAFGILSTLVDKSLDKSK